MLVAVVLVLDRRAWLVKAFLMMLFGQLACNGTHPKARHLLYNGHVVPKTLKHKRLNHCECVEITWSATEVKCLAVAAVFASYRLAGCK